MTITSMSLIWGQWTSDTEVESLDLESPKQCSLCLNVTRSFPIWLNCRCQELVLTWTTVRSEGLWKLLAIWRLLGSALIQAPPGSPHSLLTCLLVPAHTSFSPTTKVTMLHHKNLTMLFSTFIFLFFKIYLFNLFLFMAALGLRCCARGFSSCSERELLFIVVCGLCTVVASLIADHGL